LGNPAAGKSHQQYEDDQEWLFHFRFKKKLTPKKIAEVLTPMLNKLLFLFYTTSGKFVVVFLDSPNPIGLTEASTETHLVGKNDNPANSVLFKTL
jgi:hypothetical protein